MVLCVHLRSHPAYVSLVDVVDGIQMLGFVLALPHLHGGLWVHWVALVVLHVILAIVDLLGRRPHLLHILHQCRHLFGHLDSRV